MDFFSQVEFSQSFLPQDSDMNIDQSTDHLAGQSNSTSFTNMSASSNGAELELAAASARRCAVPNSETEDEDDADFFRAKNVVSTANQTPKSTKLGATSDQLTASSRPPAASVAALPAGESPELMTRVRVHRDEHTSNSGNSEIEKLDESRLHVGHRKASAEVPDEHSIHPRSGPRTMNLMSSSQTQQTEYASFALENTQLDSKQVDSLQSGTQVGSSSHALTMPGGNAVGAMNSMQESNSQALNPTIESQPSQEMDTSEKSNRNPAKTSFKKRIPSYLMTYLERPSVVAPPASVAATVTASQVQGHVFTPPDSQLQPTSSTTGHTPSSGTLKGAEILLEEFSQFVSKTMSDLENTSEEIKTLKEEIEKNRETEKVMLNAEVMKNVVKSCVESSFPETVANSLRALDSTTNTLKQSMTLTSTAIGLLNQKLDSNIITTRDLYARLDTQQNLMESFKTIMNQQISSVIRTELQNMSNILFGQFKSFLSDTVTISVTPFKSEINALHKEVQSLKSDIRSSALDLVKSFNATQVQNANTSNELTNNLEKLEGSVAIVREQVQHLSSRIETSNEDVQRKLSEIQHSTNALHTAVVSSEKELSRRVDLVQAQTRDVELRLLDKLNNVNQNCIESRTLLNVVESVMQRQTQPPQRLQVPQQVRAASQPSMTSQPQKQPQMSRTMITNTGGAVLRKQSQTVASRALVPHHVTQNIRQEMTTAPPTPAASQVALQNKTSSSVLKSQSLVSMGPPEKLAAMKSPNVVPMNAQLHGNAVAQSTQVIPAQTHMNPSVESNSCPNNAQEVPRRMKFMQHQEATGNDFDKIFHAMGNERQLVPVRVGTQSQQPPHVPHSNLRQIQNIQGSTVAETLKQASKEPAARSVTPISAHVSSQITPNEIEQTNDKDQVIEITPVEVASVDNTPTTKKGKKRGRPAGTGGKARKKTVFSAHAVVDLDDGDDDWAPPPDPNAMLFKTENMLTSSATTLVNNTAQIHSAVPVGGRRAAAKALEGMRTRAEDDQMYQTIIEEYEHDQWVPYDGTELQQQQQFNIIT